MASALISGEVAPHVIDVHSLKTPDLEATTAVVHWAWLHALVAAILNGFDLPALAENRTT
jgi:hypothetical protein